MATRKEIKDGYIPVLDFSALDPYIEPAVRNGYRRLFIYGGDVNKKWLDVGRELSEEESVKQFVDVWHQVFDYMRSKGINQFTFKVGDEPHPPLTDDDRRFLERIKAVGEESRREGYLNVITPAFCKELRPYYTNWVSGMINVELFQQWLREGKIEIGQEDTVGFYVGAVSPWKNSEYLEERSYGWFGGYTGVKYRHFSALYSSGTRDALQLVHLCPDGVVSTPGWEGMKDGATDWEYCIQLMELISRAKNTNHAEKAKHAEEEFRSIFGEGEDATLRVKWVSRWGYGFSQVEADAAGYRMAKRKVLELLFELQGLMQ